MPSYVICFAGPIGSGKTSISRRVAIELRWPLASFGSYVREWALAHGFDRSRKGLQLAGETLIKLGWGNFCKAVLTNAGWQLGDSVIIDGIRHLEALEAIKRITAPSSIHLIYLTLAEPERKRRLKARDAGASDAPDELDSGSTESQVKTTLLLRADFILANTDPVEMSTRKVLGWIKSLAPTQSETIWPVEQN